MHEARHIGTANAQSSDDSALRVRQRPEVGDSPRPRLPRSWPLIRGVRQCLPDTNSQTGSFPPALGGASGFLFAEPLPKSEVDGAAVGPARPNGVCRPLSRSWQAVRHDRLGNLGTRDVHSAVEALADVMRRQRTAEVVIRGLVTCDQQLKGGP